MHSTSAIGWPPFGQRSAPAPVPKSVTSPKFVEWLTDRYTKLVPLHRWLIDHVGD
jgi:hypothetical protein